MKTKIDTVIFDYGNTLVLDPFLQILETRSTEFHDRLSAKGYGCRWQHLAQSWVKANKELNLPFASHFYQEKEIIERALRRARIDEADVFTISQELLDVYRGGFKEVLTKDARRTEIKQTLIYLKKKNLKLGVLSNERTVALDLALRCYGVIDLFDLVLSSEEVKVEKPDTKVFSYALESLNSRPETSIYVGDDPIRDILPAKKIGMRTVLYIPPPRYSLKASWRSYTNVGITPDFMIRKLVELRQIV